MRAVLQRVRNSSVTVAGEVVGEIGKGLLVLVAVEPADGLSEVEVLAEKMSGLRCFEDDAGKMNLDIAAAGGDFLIVSQFTLGATLRRGRRPSFDGAAAPAVAEPLVGSLVDTLRQRGHRVEEGRFGAQMDVALLNDGPVTFLLEVRQGKVQ